MQYVKYAIYAQYYAEYVLFDLTAAPARSLYTTIGVWQYDMLIKLFQCCEQDCPISNQATNALVKIEWWKMHHNLWLYRLQHWDVWTFIVWTCRQALILFLLQLIVVGELKAFQNHMLE